MSALRELLNQLDRQFREPASNYSFKHGLDRKGDKLSPEEYRERILKARRRKKAARASIRAERAWMPSSWTLECSAL